MAKRTAAPRKPSSRRKFDGQSFNFHRRYNTKTEAKRIAKGIRDKGAQARLVQTKAGWSVYTRGVRR